ncbi:hypothetical protein ACVNHC_16315 [Pannonibacter sp. Q-1]
MADEKENKNDTSPEEVAASKPWYEDAELRGEFIGELRAFQHIISSPPPQDSAVDQKIHAAMRGFVGLAKELSDPENANPLVIDNFDGLREKYAKDLEGALHEKSGAQRTPHPDEQTTRQARMLADGLGLASGSIAPAKEKGASSVTASVQSDRRHPTPDADLTAPKCEPPIASVARVDPDQAPVRIDDSHVPVHQLDRRTVERQPSDKPLFSFVAETYLSSWLKRNPEAAKDVASARSRKEVFIELIGDHPVDTYTGADLQAFIEFLKFYPSNPNSRPSGKSAREIISANQTLELTPLSKTSIQMVYVSNVKSMIRHGIVDYEYMDPFDGVRLRYPNSVPGQVDTEPLSADQISRIFREGVASGLMDNTMLPLLGHLTGRRLGLLTYLKGADIWEKFPGIWVAQTSGIYFDEEMQRWRRVPYKTGASTRYFVLHPFLKEIGYIDWASKQEVWLFPGLMKLADPAKSASQYMGRLFKKAGVKTREHSGREIFHSLRGGLIEDLRAHGIDARDRRLQVGHKLADTHDDYGFKSLTEKAARHLAQAPLNEEIDYSMFQGLNFKEIAKNKRSRGRKKSK